MIAHSVIAPIIVPAVVAGLVILFARANLAVQRLASLAAIALLIGLSLYNIGLASGGPVPYFLGNWPAPFGIALVLDNLSAMMVLLVAVLAAVVLVYTTATGWDGRGRHFHALFMFQLMGLNGAFLTGDAFNLFVFFEVLLIASYGLMVHGGGAARLRAGVQYVAFNLLGSTLFLFALAVIYSVTGTLNMADLAQKMPLLPEGDAALVRASAVMLLMVFAIKGALVPLQFWLPHTYALSAGPVAALFAVMTKVGAYSVIRFGTLVFTPSLSLTGGLWGDILWIAALASIAVGALGVLAAQRLGMMIGFSIIGSMGALFLAVAQFSPASIAAALYYVLHSTLAAALLFLLADLIAARRGHDDFAQPAPAFAQSGLLGSMFMMAAIAMVGLPPLSGFVGKFMILQALSEHAATAWSAVLLGSLVTMVGFGRAGSALFWRDTGLAPQPAKHPPAQPQAFAAVFMLALGLVALTVLAGPITQWLAQTAQGLLAPAPYIDALTLPKAVP
jgi:multicomponent K+:H+ antiporter subunit D